MDGMIVKKHVVSLFSGCGGFDLGFSDAGFKVCLALDADPTAVATYNHNRKTTTAYKADLQDIDGCDIVRMLKSHCSGTEPVGVIGGAPCQSFSHSNVHASPRDQRHTLPRRYAEILKILNKTYALDFFVFENVRGLTFNRHRRRLAGFRKMFENAGFNLFETLVDAADFGVPQIRPRLIVVGLNKKKYPHQEFRFPTPITNARLSVRSAIWGLPPPAFFRKGITISDIPHHPNHWAMRPKSVRFRNGTLNAGQTTGRSFRVLAWDQPSWTVAYGNREVHIHPSGKRRLSVFEAMLLQGFPVEYELLGTLSSQIKQVSDAMPPQVGKAVGKAIMESISTS